VSFHPKMAYDATFHKSTRTLADAGPPFVFTAENRAQLDEIDYPSGASQELWQVSNARIAWHLGHVPAP